MPYADPEKNKEYQRDYQRQYAREHPPTIEQKERQATYRRGYRLAKKYKLTLAEYQAMVDAQESRCAICGQLTSDLHVDHCHSSDRIRGLLCHGCNVALGHMGDNVERLMRAADYLQSSKVEAEEVTI